jgi:diguanylate cyclase (GGDEF)-like protein
MADVHFLDKARDLSTERYAETNRWFWVTSAIGGVALAGLLVAAIPSLGWLPFVLVGIPALLGSIGHLTGSDLSERPFALSLGCWLVGVGICAAATGGADSFLLPFLSVYSLAFFSRLPPAQAMGCTWSAFTLAMVPVLVTDWSGFVASPWLACGTAVGLLPLTLIASQMAAGELRHRSEATIDKLTGLLNRRGLTDRLDELSKQATVIDDGTPLALVASDVDHFKQINDTFGHARGDDVLRDVAYLIRKALRRFELAYRTGGEEFLVVLPGHDVATATALAESIRVAVENGKPGGVDITISLGVAVRPAAGVDVTAILEDADAAVYAAKRNGRNRVETARDPTTAHMDPPVATP